jgi:hypothetical protein
VNVLHQRQLHNAAKIVAVRAGPAFVLQGEEAVVVLDVAADHLPGHPIGFTCDMEKPRALRQYANRHVTNEVVHVPALQRLTVSDHAISPEHGLFPVAGGERAIHEGETAGCRVR